VAVADRFHSDPLVKKFNTSPILALNNGVACVRQLLGGHHCADGDRAVSDLLVRDQHLRLLDQTGSARGEDQGPVFRVGSQELVSAGADVIALPRHVQRTGG